GGPEIRVKGEEGVDAGGGGTEVLGDDFGSFGRNTAVVFVDLLKRVEDELLRLLEIIVVNVGHHLADDIEIDGGAPGKGGGGRSLGVCLIGLSHSALLPVARFGYVSAGARQCATRIFLSRVSIAVRSRRSPGSKMTEWECIRDRMV